MGDVVVITHSATVAQWSRQVAGLTGRWKTEFVLRPRVILLDERTAERLLDPTAPHLAFFAAWAMQDRHGPEAIRIVDEAIAVSTELAPPLQQAQVRAILNVMSAAMVEIWRKRMEPIDTFPESPAFKALREWMESRAEARGEAKILLRLLEKRGFVLSPAQRQKILTCSDVAQLEQWADRVLVAEKLEDVLS
jgi:hypothetical protein